MTKFLKFYLKAHLALHKCLGYFYKLMIFLCVVGGIGLGLAFVWVWFLMPFWPAMACCLASVSWNTAFVYAFKDEYLRWYEINIENALIDLKSKDR